MIIRVRRWLSPPIFPDDEQTRLASLLNLLLIALLVLVLLDAALLLIFAPETLPTFWMNGLVVVGCAVLLWMMRRGHVRSASVLLCLTLWPLTAYYLAISGGLSSPALGFLMLLAAVGVTLFGVRGAISLGVITAVFLAVLYFAGTSGSLQTMEAPPTLARLFATNSAILFMMTALLAISGRSIQSALSRAREGERKLAERNRELQREIAEHQQLETERNQTEKALAQERILLRRVIDMLPDNIFVKDVEGRFLLNNKISMEILGVTRQEELLGKTDFDFLPLNLAEESRMHELKIIESRQPVIEHEEFQPWQTETWRWLTYSTLPLFDTQGEVIGLVGTTHDITERKRAEEREHAIARSLRSVVEAADELIAIQNIDTFYRRAVELAREKLNVERASIFILDPSREYLTGTYGTDEQGRTVDEHDARLSASAFFQDVLRQNDAPWNKVEKSQTFWDGEQFQTIQTGWVIGTTIRVDGQPMGVFSNDTALSKTPIDPVQQEAIVVYCSLLGTIIGNKHAEAALAKERNLLRAVIDMLPDNIFVKDAESRFVLNNAASLEILGASRQEELIGKSDFDFFPREKAERWRADELAIMQSGQPVMDVELFQPWRTDKRRWIIDSMIPLRDETGKVSGVLGVSRDISAQKQAEDSLRQYAARLNILYQIDHAILTAASAEEIAQTTVQRIRQLLPCQYVSIGVFDDAAAEWTLLAADTSSETVQNPGSRYTVDAQWLETLSRESAYLTSDLQTFSHPLLADLHKQGWHHLVCMPLVVHGRRLGTLDLIADDPGVFARTYLDIGRELADQLAIALESAQLYALSQRHTAELEQRVKERTEQLEAANRAKSAFLATMNHELRTPLNAILGFTDLLLQQGNPTPEQKTSLNVIERSGKHLLDLINDVLDMSRIEAGGVTVDESSFDLHETIAEAVQLLTLRAVDKKLNLQADILPDVPRVIRSDQRKLRQILINLLSNAVKFTDSGSIVVRVQYAQELDQRGMLQVEVEDTGYGIAEEEIDKLFQPFSQTESGRMIQQGTGLGLALTRQFIEILGGDIHVKSQLGQGTTFTFTLPVKQEVLPSTSINTTKRRVIGLIPTPIKYRILIVDDAEENRLLLRKLLLWFGFEIREAINGKEAVELHELWEPHLIFMDMRMPTMDGYEATRRIKASKHGQATAIIALTASAFEEASVLVLSADYDDYLRKPVAVSDLLAMIEQHLGVQFIYEEDKAVMSGSSSPGAEEFVLTRADMLELPASWIRDLHALAVMADSNRMLRKIEEIQDEYPRLASALTALVKTFHLETLLALTSAPTEQE